MRLNETGYRGGNNDDDVYNGSDSVVKSRFSSCILKIQTTKLISTTKSNKSTEIFMPLDKRGAIVKRPLGVETRILVSLFVWQTLPRQALRMVLNC
jgi:hypothetical protein